MSRRVRRVDRTGVAAAAAALALVVGLGSAAVGAARTPGGQSLWLVVAVKVAAAVLPLAALRARPGPGPGAVVRVLAWAAALGLTGYGFVRTTAGLLAELVLALTDARDDTTLAWHAFVGDPWLLLWGLLAAVALHSSRRRGVEPAVTDG